MRWKAIENTVRLIIWAREYYRPICAPNARIWVLGYWYAQMDEKEKVLFNTPYIRG